MKKKGFTLVELLVVIAIIALLMGILMPALARVRQLAFRMTCGTNLSGIGKAMLIYANDYEDELPRAGARKNTWSNSLGGPGNSTNWYKERRHEAYGTTVNNSQDGQVTTSASLYLLVKYAEVTPKSFVCKGESDSSEFKLADWEVPNDKELIDVWDFGYWKNDDAQNQAKHCSYSYHLPFGSYALTVAHEPTMAVAADRNPWLDSAIEAQDRWDGTEASNNKPFMPDIEPHNGSAEQAKLGNSGAHQDEGQNVLFLDSHVGFEKRSFVGIENDNIYTRQTDPVIKMASLGTRINPYESITSLRSRRDSLLVQETKGGTGGSSSGGGRGR